MKRNVLDEFLEEYHSDKPYSFGSKGHVKDHVNIHSRDISHVLSKNIFLVLDSVPLST